MVEEKSQWIIFGVIVLVIVICVAACFGDDTGSSTPKTAQCSSCGRTYQAGDNGGNFMNIAKTSMCKNCYNNFKWAQSALGN